MAHWKVSTLEKKSCLEREIWTKDDKTIVHVTGYRWGTFTVETTDDNPPSNMTTENPDGVDIYGGDLGDNVESYDLISMDDGWYADFEFENITDEEQEELLEAMEDDYYNYLDDNGWSNDDTEAWLHGPLEIIKEGE